MTSSQESDSIIETKKSNKFKEKEPKTLRGKNILVSEIISIIHDLYTHWEIEGYEMNLDTNFDEFCNSVIDVYMAYLGSKKVKKRDKPELLEVIESQVITRIQNVEELKNEDFIQKNIGIIDFLNTIETPAQRSEGWYAFRRDRITASDFAIALDKNPYSKKRDLILSKCGHGKPFNPGAAILHGVKYEDVAVNIYENRNNVKIAEYGCIPHPKHNFIGASPDGISAIESENRQLIGRMLEIKCPKSRVLNGQVPEYYFCQVQGQLEVCDLEECDFLECKIKEYKNISEFIEDSTEFNNTLIADENEVDNFIVRDVFKRKNGMEKGAVIELYDHEVDKTVFKYFFKNTRNFVTIEDIQEWEQNTISWVLNSERYDFIGISFWRLEEYSCILVKRDKEFWEILLKGLTELWNRVLYHRENGVESLLNEKSDSKDKKFKPFNAGKEYNIAFLPDTDDEECGGEVGGGGGENKKDNVSIDEKVNNILE